MHEEEWEKLITEGYPVHDCHDPESCPVGLTITLVSNKWKAFIIHELLTGKKRFGELQRSIKGISPKVLTDNLRAMEGDGLLTRTVFAEVPPHVEYELSDLGKSYCTVMLSVEEWGKYYQSQVASGKIAGKCGKK
jgi:DNA-binding HxlR family transcriptional regulator